MEVKSLKIKRRIKLPIKLYQKMRLVSFNLIIFILRSKSVWSILLATHDAVKTNSNVSKVNSSASMIFRECVEAQFL